MEQQTGILPPPPSGNDTNATAALAEAAAIQPDRRALAGLLDLVLRLHAGDGKTLTGAQARALAEIPSALIRDADWQSLCNDWEQWKRDAGPWLLGFYAAELNTRPEAVNPEDK